MARPEPSVWRPACALVICVAATVGAPSGATALRQPAASVVIVDNRTPGRFDADWATSSWSPQGFGGDYRFAHPSSRLNVALFRVPIAVSGRYDVFAWWPADRGYNASTPFRILTRDGLRIVRVDQRRDGGRWVALGTFAFEAGDDWIIGVSAQTSGSGLVIADAVKVALAQPLAGSVPKLGLGSRGGGVGELQRRLIALGYLPRGHDDGVFGAWTWHAVVAFQGWHGLARDGIVGAATHAALARAARPAAWGGLAYGLELDLRRQVLLLVAHGKTVRAVHVSTAAAGYHTPTGKFRVYRRELRSWSAPYSVWLPYALYFSEGHAIHGYASVPAFPASHGCVRTPMLEAPAVYAFAPRGTPVWVR